MSQILLVARRDYLAYVGAWGFWLSLITAPLIIAVLMFAPIFLARAEPPRVLTILAERVEDSGAVTRAFDTMAYDDARREVSAYVQATTPAIAAEVMAAFDGAPNRAASIQAARHIVSMREPRALAAFPSPSPRYILVDPPAQKTVDAPYL